MKYRLLFLLCVVYCGASAAYAARISPDQAMARLKQGQKNIMADNKLQSLQFVYTNDVENPAIYVFESSRVDRGYIVAPADNIFPPVLGVCDSGNFDIQNSSPAFLEWLEYIAGEIEYGIAHPKAIQAPASSVKQPIGPLLTSKWNQYWPYNLLCPQIDGQNTLTGCVATAMAQVMYHHRAPKDYGSGAVSYTTKSCKLPVSWDFSTTKFDWEKMYDSYQYNDNKATTPVATLMAACGASVLMDYTVVNGSGAKTDLVAAALVNYFGYNKNAITLPRYSYSNELWTEILYHELSQNRPVVYDGFSDDSGHCFVLDGYDSQGLWHINWGWGGLDDGYFQLSALNVEGYHYNAGQHAIINISPDENIVSWLDSQGGDAPFVLFDLKITEISSMFNAAQNTENVSLSIAPNNFFYNRSLDTVKCKFILAEDEDSPELFASDYYEYEPGRNYSLCALYSDYRPISPEKIAYNLYMQQEDGTRHHIKPIMGYSGFTIHKTGEGVCITLGIGDECPPVEVKSTNISSGQWLVTDRNLLFNIEIENTSDNAYNGDICLVTNVWPENMLENTRKNISLQPHERKTVGMEYTVPLNYDGKPKYDVGYYVPVMITDATLNPISANKYFTIAEDAGVNDIETDENGPAEYYNLKGIKVHAPSNMPHGIYLQHSDGKTTKTIR